MGITNSIIQNNPLNWGGFNSYHISHDGEGDDLQALAIACDALQGRQVQVDCVIGNPDIIHVSKDKFEEMGARIQLTNELFNNQIALSGANSNSEISEQYVNGILAESPSKKSLVLHTDSFKNLRVLFERAQPGQLSNVVILTYGSVNLSWAMPKPEDYKPFYESLTQSGAQLFQIEAFPFLGTKNKVTHKNTPITYSLLKHQDGLVGAKWSRINDAATAAVREKQAGKIAQIICQAMETASDEQKTQVLSHVAKIGTLFEVAAPDTKDAKALQSFFNHTLIGEKHDALDQELKQLVKLLIPNDAESKRPFNIYAGVSLEGQALIADQIPAILFSELVEERKNGILKECLKVEFEGFLNDRFATYALSSVDSSLYYLDTKKKLQQASCPEQESQLIDSYLKYIDLSIATALLANETMITPVTREHLLSSNFGQEFMALGETVKNLGYDLPKSYYKLIA